MNSLIKSSEHS